MSSLGCDTSLGRLKIKTILKNISIMGKAHNMPTTTGTWLKQFTSQELSGLKYGWSTSTCKSGHTSISPNIAHKNTANLLTELKNFNPTAVINHFSTSHITVTAYLLSRSGRRTSNLDVLWKTLHTCGLLFPLLRHQQLVQLQQSPPDSFRTPLLLYLTRTRARGTP